MRRHIVLARKLFEAEGTGVHFHISLVGGNIVTAEVTNVRVDAGANFASVRMLALFGAVVPH